MELHDGVLVQQRADGERAALRVDAEQVADEEVALTVLLPVLAHHDAEEQRVTGEQAVALVEPVVQVAQHVERRPAVERADDVALAAGDEHRLADRPAALRDDGVDRDVARQRHADQRRRAARGCRGTARCRPAARPPLAMPPILLAVRVGEVEAAHEALGIEGERVGQDDEVRGSPASTPSSARQRDASAVGLGSDSLSRWNGWMVTPGRIAAVSDTPGSLLDLAAAADHAAGRAAEQLPAAELRRDQRRHALEACRVVRRDEGDDQIRRGAAELRAHVGRRPRDRVFELRFVRCARCPFHAGLLSSPECSPNQRRGWGEAMKSSLDAARAPAAPLTATGFRTGRRDGAGPAWAASARRRRRRVR